MHPNSASPLSVICLAAVTGLSAPVFAAAQKGEQSWEPDPEKPYVLFMGADLAVQRGGRLHRVEDVVGNQLKVSSGDRILTVPTDNRANPVKVNNSLKLGRGFVRLEGLRDGPGYTLANNPQLKFAQQTDAMVGAAAVQDLAYGQLVRAASSAAPSGASQGGPGAPQQPDVDAYGDALKQVEMGGELMRSAQNNTGTYADRMQGELGAGLHDAVEVSFRISSPVQLEDPHMIILFRFQEPEAKPGVAGLLIHAETLDPIGPKPRRIHVRQSGLPPGFKYMDCEVHIYNRGEEMATNVSPKRVELSRAEAQQYLVIEHIGANKRATLPAGVVPGTLRREQRASLTPDQLTRLLYVRVSADGTLLGAYTDAGCKQKLDDAATLAVLGEVFFRPALEKGRPVEGIGRVQLGEI